MSYSLSLDRFVGKVAVVTGASAGIGQAIAEGLVKHGIIVAGVARRVERIQEYAKTLKNEKGKLHAYKADMTLKDDILNVFEKISKELGPIHILINNAGLRLATNVIDGDIDKWKSMLDTNVLGVAICTREAVKNMKEHNTKGHIINLNSIVGHTVVDYPGASLYPATKFAVTALTETVRLEINREKLPIKITSLSPGRVETEFRLVAEGMLAKGVEAPKSDGITSISAEDVAEAAFYILATPEHVNVKELIVSVQGQ